MRKSTVAYVVGQLLLVLAGLLLIPMGIAYAERGRRTLQGPIGEEWIAFALSSALSLAVGLLATVLLRRRVREVGVREGFAVVALGWIFVALFGCLPFYLTGVCSRFVDAYFETMSGFSTTGASILREIESLPHGVLFWRSFTHWLGGMGIVLLTVAILPMLGAGGYQLARAEVHSLSDDRLTPRVKETARTLWMVYLILTGAEIVLLYLGGMDLFEALCHTFGTLATGGFSTRNQSIGAYDSLYIEGVITVFMILGGASFVLHYSVLRGNVRALYRDREFRVYIATIIGGTALVSTVLALGRPERYGVFEAIRHSLFQVVSVHTTTGYSTDDFNRWPDIARLFLFVLMFIGGCAGSTGSGMKVVRVIALFKYAYRELVQLTRSRAVIAVRLGEKVVNRQVLSNMAAFFVLYMGTFAVASLVVIMILGWSGAPGPSGMGAEGGPEDSTIVTAISSVAATLGNIGPGLSLVGPAKNYAWMPEPAKWVLIACMLLGRLEIFSVLLLFSPYTWRR